MALIVQKFGGSSVADVQRIERVADIVAEHHQRGDDIVVVVSAMGDETNRLIELANAMACDNKREFDAIVATGEQVSAGLLSMALSKRHCPAISYNGSQIKILTSAQHSKARIINIDTELLQRELAERRVPVVAGFQGVTEEGWVTTMGRGGSDLTAVALAASLKAQECQIYTDVDGIYTTDPRVVPKARRLAKITVEEMLELASLGAQVLQNRCLEFAGKYQVPVRVLSSLNPTNPGTLITLGGNPMEQALVSGIALDANQAKLTIQGIAERPGLASYILGAIAEANIEVDMIVQNLPSPEAKIDFSFTVHRNDYPEALRVTQEVAKVLDAREVIASDRVAKLSLVGIGMRSHSGVASKMFSELGKEGVDIHFISASEIKISVVIDEKYLQLGARALHSAFQLDSVSLPDPH